MFKHSFYTLRPKQTKRFRKLHFLYGAGVIALLVLFCFFEPTAIHAATSCNTNGCSLTTGNFRLDNNMWGSSGASQSIFTDTGKLGWSWSNGGSGWNYPEVVAGTARYCGSNTWPSVFPLQQKNLRSESANITWKFTQKPTTGSWWNLAFDLYWQSGTSGCDSGKVYNIMIWIHGKPNFAGSLVKDNVSDGYNTYTVYTQSKGWPWYAFVLKNRDQIPLEPAANQQYSIKINIKALMDAMGTSINGNWYIPGIEFGSENSGSVGSTSGAAEIDGYTLEVNGNVVSVGSTAGGTQASTTAPTPTRTPTPRSTTTTNSAASAPAAASSSQTQNVNPTYVPGNWKLVFNDEFSGSSIDLSKWEPNWFGSSPTSITQGIASSEGQCHDPAELSFPGDGTLHMNLEQKACPSGIGRGSNMPYHGSVITTRPHFDFTYGVVEARMWVNGSDANHCNNWDAFWINGQPVSGREEYDIAECLGNKFAFHLNPGSVFGGQNSGAISNGWHVFTLDWEPSGATVYYDAQKVGTISQNVYQQPMYIIFQNATHGTNNVTAPDTMKIDYVRVWQSGSGSNQTTVSNPGGSTGNAPTPTNRPTNTSTSAPSPTPSVKLGDTNGDGHVDEADYAIWLAHFSQITTGGASVGDFNGDQMVDGIDYAIWLKNFGT